MIEEKKINEVPPSKSGKNVVIDYFRASFEMSILSGDEEEILVREKVNEIATFMGISENIVYERGYRKDKYKYMFELGPEMELGMIGPKNANGIPTCSLHLKGLGCREYESLNPDKTWEHFLDYLLIDIGAIPSRIDIAIDDYDGDTVTIPWLLEKLNKKQFVSCFKHKYHKIHGCEEEGFSIEMGSRNSSCQLMIYDKLKEQTIKKKKEVNQSYWVRYEMRFFHQKAHKLGLELLQSFRKYNGSSDTLKNQGFLEYVNSVFLGMLDIKKDNNYDVLHQTHVATDPLWADFIKTEDKWKVVPEINRTNRWSSKLNNVRRSMPGYFLVQFLKSNCNPYQFTTYILQDFREYFEKLHKKSQLKITNDYLSELGIEPITEEKLVEIETILDFELEERKLPF